MLSAEERGDQMLTNRNPLMPNALPLAARAGSVGGVGVTQGTSTDTPVQQSHQLQLAKAQ